MALGDIIYRAASLWTRLAGNTSATRKFLSQTGTGVVSAAPSWLQVTDADLSVSDITTNNASTGAHGFLKKLDNSSASFMNGQGNWATPAGAGNVSTGVTLTSGQLIVGAGGSAVGVGNLSGDATTAGGTAVTLANSGVSAGTYTHATVTVDAKGRVTAASSGSIGTTNMTMITGSDVTFADNTLANITALAQAVGASEVWIVDGWFYLTNAATTGDFKYSFTGPSGATFIAGGHRLTTATTTNTDTIGTSYGTPGSPSAGIAAGGVTSIVITATLINSTNAGTFQIQGAQNATDGGNLTSLKIGSWARFTRVS